MLGGYYINLGSYWVPFIVRILPYLYTFTLIGVDCSCVDDAPDFTHSYVTVPEIYLGDLPVTF